VTEASAGSSTRWRREGRICTEEAQRRDWDRGRPELGFEMLQSPCQHHSWSSEQIGKDLGQIGSGTAMRERLPGVKSKGDSHQMSRWLMNNAG
jgi:hypothetical protein